MDADEIHLAYLGAWYLSANGIKIEIFKCLKLY